MSDAETIAWYDREAESYAQATLDHGERESLKAFEARLPRGARVLDFGCGGGHEAAWLQERGHEVTAQDASAGLAREAMRRWGVSVRVAPFEALDDVALYDGVWSAAALHHVPSAQIPAILSRIARALKPEGTFAGTFKGGPERRDGFGRYFAALDVDAVQALFADRSVWSAVELKEARGQGHDGVETPWLLVTALRA